MNTNMNNPSDIDDILVVEDNLSSLKLLTDILREAGYQVRPAGDGELALRSVQAKLPTLIMLDIRLPDIDGYEVCRRLKESEYTREVPVIFISALAETVDKVRAFGVGGVDYVTKPFEPKEVLARVRTHTTIRQMQLQLEKQNLQLQESEKRYQSVSELTSDYIFHICVGPDKQMIVDWITEGFTKLTGYNLEEVKYPELWEKVVHPDDISGIKGFFQKIIIGNTETLEFRIITKTNKTLFFYISGQPEWDNKKQDVIGIIGAVAEITERRLANNLLQEKEQQMRLFMLSTNDSIWNWDMVAGTVERSIGFERAFGYTTDEMHPGIEWWTERLHPDDKERVWQTFNDAVAGEKAFCGYEYRFRCRDGTYSNIEDSVCIIRDDTGKVIRSLGAMKDITDRKMSEDKLQKSFLEMKTVNTLINNINAHLPFNEVVQAVLEGVVSSIAPDLVLLFLREGDNLILQGFQSKDSGFQHEETPVHKLGECLCGLAAMEGKPMYSYDIQNDSRCTWEECKKAGILSFAALPLSGSEKVLGVMGLAAGTKKRDFTGQATYLETISNSIAIGLENSLLYEKTRKQSNESAMVNKELRKEISERKRAEENLLQKTGLIRLQQEITLTANEAQNSEEALRICINKVCYYSCWPIGHVYILDSTGKLSPTAIWYTSNPNKFKEFRKISEDTTFSIGEGLPGRVLRDARPHWIVDVTRDPGFIRTKLVKQINVKGAFAFPVLERERVVAVLEFFSEEVEEPDLLMMDTITQLATQLGRVTERKRAEDQIKASLREKEILIGEIYHRTKNNMQVICALLNMQSKYTKDEQTLAMFKEIDNRIKSMSLVHSKLYQSKDLSNINLKSYIEDLAHNLFNAYKINPDKISLKLMADDVLITFDSAIPCCLVINEIITNSLKYAFPNDKEGEIRVSLRLIADCGLQNADYEQSFELPKSEIRNPKSKMIELKIADNGIGMPKGFDPGNTNTLGLQIIFNSIENQLQGKVDLDLENGVGYRIKFKEPKRLKRI